MDSLSDGALPTAGWAGDDPDVLRGSRVRGQSEHGSRRMIQGARDCRGIIARRLDAFPGGQHGGSNSEAIIGLSNRRCVLRETTVVEVWKVFLERKGARRMEGRKEVCDACGGDGVIRCLGKGKEGKIVWFVQSVYSGIQFSRGWARWGAMAG